MGGGDKIRNIGDLSNIETSRVLAWVDAEFPRRLQFEEDSSVIRKVFTKLV